MADVVVEVELGVVDPYRPALSVGDEPQLLAEPRHEVEARADVIAELSVTRGRPFEHGRRGDVHVRGALLHVEERGIEAAEPVAVHVAVILPNREVRDGCHTRNVSSTLASPVTN